MPARTAPRIETPAPVNIPQTPAPAVTLYRGNLSASGVNIIA